ncbi:MAG: hypothetical protein LBI15_10055 [Dysgonamonadaceae bacterium]|jgi:hypothetical protein|nr:hypothetical protein [Dysgonamonadaceae bacterium]
MAHTAKLKLDNGREYNLLNCDYEFYQPTQASGEPCAGVFQSPIRFVVKSPANDDLFFYKWMQYTNQTESGQIIFMVFKKGEITPQTLNFTNAYCVYLHESFDSYGEGQMLTTIAISSANKITFGEQKKEQPIAAYSSSEDVEKNTKKLYWIDADTYEEVEANTGCQKLRLYFETEGYVQDEQVTATITKDDGSMFADNSTELIFTGIVDKNGKAISKEIYEADKT